MGTATLIYMIVSSLIAGVAMALVMRFSNPKQDFYRKKDGTLDDTKFVIVGAIVAAAVLILEAFTWVMLTVDRKRAASKLRQQAAGMAA